jgi:sigma-B regulation protein RsbU (phosphoserine phosphatase)
LSENHGEDVDASTVLDEAACALMQTAADGTFLRVNRAFCNWTGHAADALVGRRRFQDLLTMGGRIFHQTHWAPLLHMQGSISEVKLEVVHADGTAIPMVFNGICRKQAGVVIHELAAFIARDRDKYERELIQSRKRLEALVAESARLQAEAKDRALFAEQMIGIVSHDLRNPMSSIQMGTHLLTQSEPSHNQQRILTRIERSVGRANRLIADLLDFTQARLGKGLTIAPEAIDLHDTTAETVDELSTVYPARKLNHVRLGDGLCVADANRLAQLVGNLVSNAMVYGSPEKAVTVTSTVDLSSFSIAVHNEGAPIALDAQARLFQPMARGTNATNAGRSVGLGLFIVSEIAKAHGGKALVRSTPEQGTTFSVVMPRLIASQSPA